MRQQNVGFRPTTYSQLVILTVRRAQPAALASARPEFVDKHAECPEKASKTYYKKKQKCQTKTRGNQESEKKSDEYDDVQCSYEQPLYWTWTKS